MTENWSLYHPEIPEFLRRLAETPPMARLRQVGMNVLPPFCRMGALLPV